METLEDRPQLVEVLHEISRLSAVPLDRKTIDVVLSLLELGIHPESIAEGRIRLL